MLAEVVNRDDVAVRQLPCGACLAEEALALFDTRFDALQDDLDRNHTVEQRVERPVDDTHAALSDSFDELIAADAVHVGCLSRAANVPPAGGEAIWQRLPDDSSRRPCQSAVGRAGRARAGYLSSGNRRSKFSCMIFSRAPPSMPAAAIA